MKNETAQHLLTRYFYPLISEFSIYKGLESANPENQSVAEKMAKQVISLPINPALNMENVNQICKIIKE